MNRSISSLSERYSNGVQATFYCPRGIWRLLGQKGKGKSTLIRTLATLQRADDENSTLGQIDLPRETPEPRRVISYLP